MQFKEVRIDKIKIPEDRIRKEIGPLDALKESIAKVGLIHPIVLDEEMNLVCGYRRLLACKELGFRKIKAFIGKVDDPLMKFTIEFHENLVRKGLTWVEELEALLKEKELYEQKFPQSKKIRKYSLPHLRALKPKDLQTFIQFKSRATGMSPSRLYKDLQLAEGLTQYPWLKEIKTKTKAFKELEKITGKTYYSRYIKGLNNWAPFCICSQDEDSFTSTELPKNKEELRNKMVKVSDWKKTAHFYISEWHCPLCRKGIYLVAFKN